MTNQWTGEMTRYKEQNEYTQSDLKIYLISTVAHIYIFYLYLFLCMYGFILLYQVQ